MILEKGTFEKFGYYPSDLTPKSGKPIIAVCDDCGKVRITTKHQYHALCKSCARKGNTNALGYTHTEEAKARICAALKGNTHSLGYKHTEETKAKNSAVMKGKKQALGSKHSDEANRRKSAAQKGGNNPNWRGGRTLRFGRGNARRKKLGYTLLMPLAEGEAGHHVTDEYVIGVPMKVHNSIGGRRRKHRTLVLQWLKTHDKKKYLKVLCVLAKEPSK